MNILTSIRETIGLSRGELAKLSGVPRSTLYDIETFNREVPEKHVDSLAKVLAEHTNIAYVAGLFDRSSSWLITRLKVGFTNTAKSEHYLSRIHFCTKHKILAETIKSIMGVGEVCWIKDYKNKNNGHWLYYAHCKSAAVVAEKLLPYLIIKKGKAETLIEFQELRMGVKKERFLTYNYGINEYYDFDAILDQYEVFYKRIRE